MCALRIARHTNVAVATVIITATTTNELIPKMIDQNLNKIFAKRLKEERDRLGLSQTQLAIETGISRLLISRYELAKTLPGTEVLLKMNERGVDVSFLITGKRSLLDREPELFNRAHQEVKRQVKDSGEVLSSKEHSIRAWAIFNALNSSESALNQLRSAA